MRLLTVTAACAALFVPLVVVAADILDIKRPRLSTDGKPVQDSLTVQSCVNSQTCPVTIEVSQAPSGTRDCEFKLVPDIIDVSSASPKIEWILKGATGSTDNFSFGWYRAGTLLREGIRIRDSAIHDLLDGPDTLPGPMLADEFKMFDRPSERLGYTELDPIKLGLAKAHRFFYYRIHVTQTDPHGTHPPILCKPFGPMILNRG